jgi:hypothetical protein
MAKEFINTAIILPRHFAVTTPGWQIKLNNRTIIANIDQTLYELVHTGPPRDYWIRKNRISESTYDSVNWARLGQALANMPLTRRFFCAKHTSGMCGVGKFQKIWKMRETDSCPHCGKPEDAVHVWTCDSPAVDEVWTQSLLKLESTLKKLDTDPQLLDTIIAYLHSWRSEDNLQPLRSREYKSLIDKQNTIGPRQFFEGWHHIDWELMQELYYQNIKSRQSAKRWTIAVITKLWDTAWDLWEFQNLIFHHQENQSTRVDMLLLDKQIGDLHSNMNIIGLLPKDQHLTEITLDCLLAFPRRQKVEWMTQVALALDQSKLRHFQIRRSQQEHHRRHQSMLESMRRSL